MEEQQKRQVAEVEKEHKIREMAGPPTGSATEMKTKTRTFFTQTTRLKTGEQGNQTNNPKMVSTESQAWRPNIASVSSQSVPETRSKTEDRANQTNIPKMATTGSQAWRPNIASVHSQAVPEMTNTGTDPGNVTIFDMTSNDKFDVDMTDAINQQEDEKQKKENNIKNG